MKRKKTLIILSVAFLVLIGVIVAEVLITRHVDSINSVDMVVLSVEEENLTALTWKTEDGEISFTKTEDVWYLDADEKFPVDQEYMSNFLADFSEVHASFEITDVEDYDQYGLGDPVCTMNFKTEEGEDILAMGTFSTMDSKRYICVNSGDVYLIDEDLYEMVSTDKDVFLDNIDIPTITTLTEYTISGDSELTFIYDTEGDYTYTDSYSYYMTSDGGYQEVSTSLAKVFINYIIQADISEYATYTASEEDLSTYGLAEPAFSVTVTGLEGEDEASVTLLFGETEKADVEVDEGTTLTDADLINAYMMMEGSEIVYIYDTEDYIAMRDADYDSIRPAEVLSLDWELPTSMTATVDEVTSEIVFTRDEEAETVTCTIGETEIDFDDIKSAISALSMAEFNDETPEKKEELSITINQDKTGYEQMSVTFYQYDGENCLVVRNGETLGLMSRSLMVDLREAIIAVTLN